MADQITKGVSLNERLAHNWFGPGRFSLILALITLASFPEVMLGLKTFVYRDFGLFSYPLAYYFRESFWRGELQLWNPLSNCGIPFLAQWNTLVCYPPSLLYLLLPLPWSLNFFCLVHLFFAGLGMYFLAHRWIGNRLAAALAGVAFAFNGFTLASLMWPAIIAALSWMPWVVWRVETSWHTGGRKVTEAAFLSAMQMLTGAPELILLTWGLLAMLLLHALFSGTGNCACLIARFVGVVALVCGLCAVQLLPFLDLVAHSQRQMDIASSHWSMPLWGWANLFVPLFRTSEAASGVAFQISQSWTSSYYPGIGTLVLGLWASARVKPSQLLLLALCALACSVLALGEDGHLYRFLRSAIPLLKIIRYPVKFVACLIFVLPLLAAAGVQKLSFESSTRKRAVLLITLWATTTALIAGIVAFAFFKPIPDQDWAVVVASGVTRAVFLAIVLTGLWLWGRFTKPSQQVLVGIGLIATVWLDAYTHAPPQNPMTESTVYSKDLRIDYPISPRPKPGDSRAALSLDANEAFGTNRLANQADNFIFMRLWLYQNCNLLEGIPKVDGFFALYLPRERDIHLRMYGADNQLRPRLADFMSVSQVTAKEKERTFEWTHRQTYLPLVTIGQKPEFLDSHNTLMNLMHPSFNPRDVVYLPIEAKTNITAVKVARAGIRSYTFASHRINVEVETEEPTMLVISQVYYHPWKARVDRVTQRLWPANHAFQALQVPAGRHQITLTYEDRWFRLGEMFSAFSLLIAGFWWVRGHRYRTEPG
jgi:hypothetical protein